MPEQGQTLCLIDYSECNDDDVVCCNSLIDRSVTQVKIMSEAGYNFFQDGNSSAAFRPSSAKNSLRRSVLTGFLHAVSS